MPDPSFRNPRTGALSAIAKYIRGLIDETEFKRQQRGEDFFPRGGMHATRAQFNEFNQKKGDLGFHFGTEEQARQRMIHTRDSSNEHLPERYIDARLRANNPLYYPGDVGAWEYPSESASALLASRPYGASTREGFAKIISDKERDWLQKIRDGRILTDRHDALEEMRQMMEKQGFDSLIYRNTVENLHGAIPGMSPRALEAYNRLQQQRLAIDLKRAEDYRKANPRSVNDMPPRDPQTQKLIPFSDPARQRDFERWEKGRRPWTEEERARDLALYNRMNKIEGIGQNDPNSIIVLRPNQIRSIDAEFDPAKLSSGNLMAGTAAGAIGIGAATAGEEEREPYGDGGPVNPRLGALAKLAARIANPIRAYHGSPHKFDKFDISKIGTGEGAQAYGHGLYFAENPKVAADYRDQLSRNNLLTLRTNKGIIQGDKIDPIDLEVAKYLDIGARDAGQFKHNTAHYAKIAAQKAGLPDVVKRIDDYGRDVSVGWEKNPGSLYTVDLHVPQERLLDWDAPLMQQSHIIEALGWPTSKARDENMRGSSVYAARSAFDGGRRASQELLERGIPGVRYLDQGSRLTGNAAALVDNYGSREAALDVAQKRLGNASFGDLSYWQKLVDQLGKPETRNYVMFNDAPIEIVERKAEGGMVDPDGINKEPMASGGALAMSEGGSVYERLVERVRAAFEEQEAPGFADGGDIDWNSYAQTYQQMLNPAMSGSTGLSYTEPVGAQQQPVDPIGSRLSSFTPGSAGVPGGAGQATVDTRSVSVPGMSAGRALGAMGTLGSAITGVGGLGLAGAALGNALEAREYNAALDTARSASPQYSFPGLSFGQIASGIANTVTGGLLGTSLNDSFVDNGIAGTSQSRGGASGPGTGDPEADAAAAAAAASSGLGNAAEAAVDSGQIS